MCISEQLSGVPASTCARVYVNRGGFSYNWMARANAKEKERKGRWRIACVSSVRETRITSKGETRAFMGSFCRVADRVENCTLTRVENISARCRWKNSVGQRQERKDRRWARSIARACVARHTREFREQLTLPSHRNSGISRFRSTIAGHGAAPRLHEEFQRVINSIIAVSLFPSPRGN